MENFNLLSIIKIFKISQKTKEKLTLKKIKSLLYPIKFTDNTITHSGIIEKNELKSKEIRFKDK